MHAIIFISAFLFVSFLSAFLTQNIYLYTITRSILDIPNERSSHTVPTPSGGGAAIVVVTLSGLLLTQVLWPSLCPWSKLSAYLFGALLISIISWLDDLHSLSLVIRFCAHSLAAFMVLAAFGCWKVINLPILGQIDLGLIGPPATFFWIVGLTNSYNFMDGIDGIAGGQALVAGLSWLLLGWLINLPMAKASGILLAASSLGFLRYNWPPARIFMGDVGSIFLGYSFACLAVIGSQKDPFLGLAGILLVWPFIFDTGFTFFRRLKNKGNVFDAHRTHLYQRLVICGYTHRTITIFYMGLEVLGLLFALLFMTKEPWADMMLISLLPSACFGLWKFTVFKERKLTVAFQTSKQPAIDSSTQP